MNCDRRRDSRNLGEVDIEEEETADQTHNPKPRHDNENRGDKSIIGFWQRGRECVFDVQITDTQNCTYRALTPLMTGQAPPPAAPTAVVGTHTPAAPAVPSLKETWKW